MYRTPRATRKPNLEVIQKRKRKGKQTAGESSSRKPSLKIRIIEEDVEKLVKGEEKSNGSDFVDTVLLSDKDFDDRLEPMNHKENPKEVDDDKAKDNKLDDDKDDKNNDDDDDGDDNNNDDDHNDHLLIQTRKTVANVVKKERDSSTTTVPALISQEFATHKIIEELFRIYMKNTVLNVHPPTSTFTKTTSDLQQQLYLRMKSNLQAQVDDLEL
nr:hypothetical protein [Tanacetum cinerariifolium]